MSHKRQKPKKRKAYGGRPQKIHKINGRSTHVEMAKHIKMLQAQGKLSEAIENNEINDDTIPDLIKETITGVYRMTTTLICLRELLKERTISLIPGFETICSNWDRQVIRFEENASAYLVLKEHQIEQIEQNPELNDTEKETEIKDDTSLSDIVWDLVDGINELFLNHAVSIADLAERHSKAINAYINDHVLENETPNEFATRVCVVYIEGIREKHATKLPSEPVTAEGEVNE